MQGSDPADGDRLLAELASFAERVLPRCPPDIDPHHFGSRLGGYQYLAIAAEAVGLASGATILDWGAGFGHVSFLLARLGARVEAYDVTHRFEEIDRTLLDTPGVRFARRPPDEPMPYEEGQFTIALSVGTLEHVTDEARALADVRRVLAPGGRFLIYHLPNRRSYIEAIAKRAGKFYHERAYTPASATALLQGHGFAVERVTPYHVLPRSSISRLGAMRSFSEKHYRGIDAFDAALAKIPPLSFFVTAFTIHARRT
ncbi:MAG: class I SAM-dependent methyltransferase [Acidobacteriota bacterium]